MAGRLHESDRRRVEFGAYDVAARVARLLLELASRHGLPATGRTGTTISVPLAQHELAGATGASREAVSRALRQLRESGAIATGRRQITARPRQGSGLL
jgi:CRP/FNR family cyclic AMP-dependent transcriptional regulator